MDEIDALKKDSRSLGVYLSRTKLKKDGQEYIGLCPFHMEHTPSFRVYRHSGVWLFKCFGGCTPSGNVVQFVQEFENVSVQQAIETVKKEYGESIPLKKQVQEVEEESPKQYVTYDADRHSKYEAALEESAEAQDYLLKARGITYETAKRLRFGYRTDLPGGDKWIVLPSFEDDSIVSIEYRSITRKDFRREPDMATVLWNTQTIDPFEDLFITEGKYDAAVLEQTGYRAVSLPTAGYKLTAADRVLLLQAHRVFLAGDNDGGVGTEAMNRIRADLGSKSFMLNWPEAKDANEAYLKNPAGFKELVDSQIAIAVTEPLIGTFSLLDSMRISVEESPLERKDRLRFPWDCVDRMAILPPGSVCYISASATGMGKTVFTNQLAIHNAKMGEIVLNYQAEMEVSEIGNITAAHVLGKERTKVDWRDVRAAAGKLGSIKYYVGRNPDLDKVNDVLDAVERDIRELGATVIILDHIHHFCRDEENVNTALENAMKRIKKLATKYKRKFVVLGQPRKPDSRNPDRIMSIGDIKGAEAVGSDSTAVFIIHRKREKDQQNGDAYEPFTQVHCLKARFKGPGKSFEQLYYNGGTATFRELGAA